MEKAEVKNRRVWVLALVLAAACGSARGRFMTWSLSSYDVRGRPEGVAVYEVEYDSIVGVLRSVRAIPPHDTIGIVVQEPKLVEEFESREEYWKRDSKVIDELRHRAWEMGGDMILVGTPEIGRRGLRDMLRRFVEGESSADGNERALQEIDDLRKNPWVAHIAYVLRSRG